MRPAAADPPAETLALVAAIALYAAAAPWLGGADAGLRIKWPNDLMLGPAKLAGILLERGGPAIIVGFGVNLASAPVLADRPTACIAAATGLAPEPGPFLRDLAREWAGWVGRWRGEGMATVRRAWLDRAHPAGTPLAAQGADGRRIEGLFETLDSSGALILRQADGSIETIRTGDVFLL